MELVYKGSVKDLYKHGQNIVFQYSDRYSIFDWGEMPDGVPFKGQALASMATSFFKFLDKKGIPSHFISEKTANSIEVQAVKVIRPQWIEGRYDYSAYSDAPVNCLVPLEVIFRRFLGQGNSLEGRLKKNPGYLQDLGLNEIPHSKSEFNPALIEFSTKLETTDRYLTLREINDMNILTETELVNLKSQSQKIVQELEKLFSSFGVQLWDGKVEFAFGEKDSIGNRELLLVDSIGPDELRLTYDGLPLSKEFLRQVYAPTNWFQAVKKAKELAAERKVQDWKSICLHELNEKPASLNPQQVAVSTLLYQSLANEIAKATGEPIPFSKECTLKRWHQEAQAIVGESR